MNIKSITSLALAAGAVYALSAAPAEAGNNNYNKYLNNLAMQMYMQNQAKSAAYYANNPYAYGYNPYAYSYNGQTPWSAGAMPYAPYGGAYNRYYNNTARYYVHHRHHHH